MLRSRLERCDKQGMAAYLESSNPQNVPLYEHFGFQVTGVLDLPEARPPSPRCGGRHTAVERQALLRRGDSGARATQLADFVGGGEPIAGIANYGRTLIVDRCS